MLFVVLCSFKQCCCEHPYTGFFSLEIIDVEFRSVHLSTLLGIVESSNCVPFDTPTSCISASISGDYCQKISLCNFFQSVEYKLYLIAVFTLHFLDYYWGWAFFLMYLLTIWIFCDLLILSLGPFFCWVVSFFSLIDGYSFYILNTNDL